MVAGSNHSTSAALPDPLPDDTASRDAQPAAIELDTPTHRGDVIAALLCLSLGLAGYFLIVPAAVYVPAKFAGTANSPAFLPNVLFILLAGLSAIYLATSVKTYLREAVQGRARNTDWLLAGGTALICIGYVGAIHLVGMTLGSALCVAAAILYFGERRPLVVGAIAIILPVLLWYFFVKIASILLPTPMLPLMNWLESSVLHNDTLAQFRMCLAGIGAA